MWPLLSLRRVSCDSVAQQRLEHMREMERDETRMYDPLLLFESQLVETQCSFTTGRPFPFLWLPWRDPSCIFSILCSHLGLLRCLSAEAAASDDPVRSAAEEGERTERAEQGKNELEALEQQRAALGEAEQI